MDWRKKKRAPGAGRPRTLEAPYRLNLYLDAGFVEDLRQLSASLKIPVSHVVTAIVQRSATYRAMKKAHRRK